MSSGGPDSSATGRAGGHPSSSGKGYSKSGPAANKPELVICCRPAQINDQSIMMGCAKDCQVSRNVMLTNRLCSRVVPCYSSSQRHIHAGLQVSPDKINLHNGGTSHCTLHACWSWLCGTASCVLTHASAETDRCRRHQKSPQPGRSKRAANTAKMRQLSRTKIECGCCTIFLLWESVDRCSWGVSTFIDIPAAVHKPTRTSHTSLQFSTLYMA